MSGDSLPQFGTLVAGVDYVDRISVYGIAFDEAGRVLVCRRTMDRIVLPGGGVDGNESLDAALRREVAEETGFRVDHADLLCRALQYHSRRLRKPPANKLCHF
jgi:8-oxo-dGTP pyrophosphatase MutT (NUDIX family)